MIKHNSQEINFREPFGAVKSGETIHICIVGEEFNRVVLKLIYFDESHKNIDMLRCENDEQIVYKAKIDIDKHYLGIIKYYFCIYKGDSVFYYGNNKEGLGGEGCIYHDNPKPYQITVYKDFKVPNWYKEGIVYQIFVDRFNNGNKDGKIDNPKHNSFIYGNWNDEPMYIKSDDGKILRWDFYGGNLQGIINKLDYLNELGVSVIYLNPIFEAVSNHKYDTGDYKKIDPMFGDDNRFKELCSKALNKGIKIVLDGVFSHTGVDSIYFNKYGNYDSIGAYESKDSEYYEWYKFQKYPNKYECWWGIDNQPNVNELNESYRNYIINDKNSVISKWMKLGAYGWRLDVADELPDEFIKELKTKMKEENEESILLGEVWEDASNKVSYSNKRRYLFGEELDSVTNYPFRNAVINFINGNINSYNFNKIIMSLYENYPSEAFYANLNVLSTHDTERIITSLNVKENLDKLIMAVAIQMTMPGVPLIYYGDESGLNGGKDPLNRKTYPWGKETLNVMKIYKALTHIRNCNDELKKGEFFVHDLNEDVLSYERRFGSGRIIIFANRNLKDNVCIKLNLGENCTLKNILNLKSSHERLYTSINSSISLELEPGETKIFVKI